MLWICKVSDHGGQRRITLPKGFIKKCGLEDAEYIGIDDRDPKRIIIRRLVYGKESEAED